MKKIFGLTILIIFSISVQAQIAIPNFKANYAKDQPFSAIENYDLILAFRSYSNWSLDQAYSLIILKDNHWRKLSYKLPRYGDPFVMTEHAVDEQTKLDNDCNLLYRKLLANNLYFVPDEEQLPKCDTYKGMVDGKETLIQFQIADGSEHDIYIITPTKTRKLYYYEPATFIKYCPDNIARKNVLSVVSLFNKER